MRKHVLPVVLVLLMPAVAGAQADSASRGELSGTVYDSVARAPLVGATVELVEASDPSKLRSVVSDGRGQYRIGGLEPGRYLIGFQHYVLDSLALNTPTRLVEIRSGERAIIDLAVPAPATIVTAVCGASGAADSTGLLLGMLRDAKTKLGFDTGSVRASWQELTLGAGQFNTTQKNVTAPVGKDGWFALCGIPADLDIAIQAWHASDSTGMVAFTVPLAGLSRHDLYIGGSAVVSGIVHSEKDRPIMNARVAIVGRKRGTLTDSAGAYRLGDVPAGSQTIEVRALGYAPELRTLILPADADTTLAITLTSVKRVLDTIRVIGQRVYDRDSNGFLRRKRLGGGYFFDEESVHRQRPYDLFRFLNQVPSIRVQYRGVDRNVVMRGGSGYCTPTLWLNGARMPSDMVKDLDLLARPEELAGMEVYRPGPGTPAQFADFNGCGAIVIWTRIPVRPSR